MTKEAEDECINLLDWIGEEDSILGLSFIKQKKVENNEELYTGWSVNTFNLNLIKGVPIVCVNGIQLAIISYHLLNPASSYMLDYKDESERKSFSLELISL